MRCARFIPAAVLAVAAGAAGLAGIADEPAKQSKKDDTPAADPQAVARTRDTVKMLDDVYKTMIVLITDKYVHAEDDTAAATAAAALFDAIQKKGWHTVRLVDATGEPYDPDNVATSDFEKDAIQKLKAGKPYVDKVVQKDGKPYLLAATAVPVVMDKCVMCHPHYKDVPKGQAIGAVSYEIPIR